MGSRLETIPAMIAAELMGAVYWRLLRKLERRQFQVFGDQPLRLNKAHKSWLILRALGRFAAGVRTSDYGTA